MGRIKIEGHISAADRNREFWFGLGQVQAITDLSRSHEIEDDRSTIAISTELTSEGMAEYVQDRAQLLLPPGWTAIVSSGDEWSGWAVLAVHVEAPVTLKDVVEQALARPRPAQDPFSEHR